MATIPLAVVAGAAILLILFGWSYWQRAWVAALQNVPGIGPALAAAIVAAGNAVVGTAQRWAEHQLGAVNALLSLLPAQVLDAFTQLNNAIAGAISYTTTTLPYALGQVGPLADRVQLALSRLVALSGDVGSLQSTIATLRDRVSTIIHVRIPNAIATAESWAQSFATDAVNAAAGTLQRAIASVLHSAYQAIDAARVELGNAIDGVGSTLTDAIDGARTWAEGELSTLHDAIDSLDLHLNGRIDGLIGVLTPILALDLARVIPALRTQVDTMERECVKPTCSALGPSLDVWNAINQGVILASVLALTGEAIRDPQGTARTTADLVEGLHDVATSIIDPLAGVQL